MTLDNLTDKKLCFLGLGIENQALLKFLLKHKIKADITVCDARPLAPSPRSFPSPRNTAGVGVRWRLGKNYDKNLDEYDIIFRIAGYPLFTKNIIKAMIKGTAVSSATKLFFDLCPTKNIVGVTGTKGKGTTASLIYAILKAAKKRVYPHTSRGVGVYFGGNIGTPMFSVMDKIKPGDWVVLELSSFQLEDLDCSPHVAVFTNFFPDHLAAADPLNPNYHKNLVTYWNAKANIFSHQSPRDILIAGDPLKEMITMSGAKSKIIYFAKSNLPTKLIGEHNKRNVAAAALAVKAAGVSPEIITQGVKKFKGLEHRLEFVAAKNDVRYYNDSFATNPDTTIIALETFKPGSIILIAGGASKNSDYRRLALAIRRRVKRVVMLPGKGAQEILAALKKIKYDFIVSVSDMRQAVRAAQKIASRGDVILLSTACASFGIFKNYKDRGWQFKKAA
ncbi:UDP-N-acetylmuramoyl-L-alanine--D-glutamate ligase, partial [Candidatus Falkowbacteria bacterium CG10_big_fil_rev_8_21_14_0_10_44_15]